MKEKYNKFKEKNFALLKNEQKILSFLIKIRANIKIKVRNFFIFELFVLKIFIRRYMFISKIYWDIQERNLRAIKHCKPFANQT